MVHGSCPLSRAFIICSLTATPSRRCALPATFRFTGQRAEPGLEGIYFYGARWYDPALGRFLAADTLVPNSYNPLDWDRYAYVGFNPINRVDPTGHAQRCPYGDLGGGCGTVGKIITPQPPITVIGPGDLPKGIPVAEVDIPLLGGPWNSTTYEESFTGFSTSGEEYSSPGFSTTTSKSTIPNTMDLLNYGATIPGDVLQSRKGYVNSYYYLQTTKDGGIEVTGARVENNWVRDTTINVVQMYTTTGVIRGSETQLLYPDGKRHGEFYGRAAPGTSTFITFTSNPVYVGQYFSVAIYIATSDGFVGHSDYGFYYAR